MSRSITPAPTPPQTITVSSTAGFNAGDLVYFNGSTGDYGTPPVSAAGATVSVPATGEVPLLGGLIGSTARDVGVAGGSLGPGFAAILTNGNIVQVYFNAQTSDPTFRIVDTTNTVVVAATSISATFTNSGAPNIAVAALTGGGFVAAWINSAGGTANRVCYAIYSNTGAVVTAAVQDTGTSVIQSYSPIRVKATPSGGFIIGALSASSAANARGYSATGVAAFAWVALVTTVADYLAGLAVRSDGSFLLVVNNGTASTVYGIWSSTGTVIVSSTSFTSTNGTFNAQTDAACLSDGTTFVIMYSVVIVAGTTAFRFLPTGNVLGAEFYIPPTNFIKAAGGYQYIQNITPLSGNRFILCMAGSAGLAPISYAVFNSSGVCLSGTSGTTSTAAVPLVIPQAYYSWSQAQISALESPAGYITLYYGNVNGKNYSVQYSTIDNTSYLLLNTTPTTQAMGNAAATPVAYAPSGSNPLGAAYAVAAGAYPASGTFGAIIKNPELPDSGVSVASIATTTLPNGQVLVAYITTGAVVKVAVYSITGVLTQTLTITASGANTGSANWSFVSISALTSGKFVIAYATNDVTYNIKLFSSSFTQIGSTVTITTSSVSTGYPLNVAGITNDRYVVAYSVSTFPYYQVYDNTNTQLVTATNIVAANYFYVGVTGFSAGGFFVSAVTSGGAQSAATYANYSGNVFTQVLSIGSPSGGVNNINSVRPVSNTNNNVYMLYPGSASIVQGYGASLGALTNVNAGLIASVAPLTSGSIGVTGSGVPVITAQISGVMQLLGILTGTGGDTVTPLSFTLFKPNTTSPQTSMTPSYGGNIGIAYIDINQKVNYAIVCGTSAPLSVALTSANPSTAINIYPGATSASPAIQNTVFTGVALQTVPAGGAGLVQVNGTAQLGSTYPAGTTYRAFDHQSQGVPGVKGTITGRAITLQGT